MFCESSGNGLVLLSVIVRIRKRCLTVDSQRLYCTDCASSGCSLSDDAYAQVYTDHKYTKDMVHAAAAGLNAGLDQEGGGSSAIVTLPAAVSANLTTSQTVELAFRRLMRARLILGMFDPPNTSPYGKIGATSLKTAEATALNRRAAREGVVMLRNNNGPDGHPLLPLSLSKYKGARGQATSSVVANT